MSANQDVEILTPAQEARVKEIVDERVLGYLRQFNRESEASGLESPYVAGIEDALL